MTRLRLAAALRLSRLRFPCHATLSLLLLSAAPIGRKRGDWSTPATFTPIGNIQYTTAYIIQSTLTTGISVYANTKNQAFRIIYNVGSSNWRNRNGDQPTE